MPTVTVDGVSYVPESRDTKPLVAIAITTRNRHDVLARTLKELDAFTPTNVPIVVVDDASDHPVDPRDSPRTLLLHRFSENVGIPRAKNKCLELCMATGADHFFLLDDDCYPAIDDWWKPYVNGAEPHYNYIFTHWTNGTAVGDCAEVYNDGKLRAFDQARGCAIYLHRSVVERVGGFNPVFGKGMNEHLEYSQRICNAGLTTFSYQDVPNGDDLWYSLDRAQSVTRTLAASDRQSLLKRNDQLLQSLQGSTEFIEYREVTENLVITQLLTANADGQRGINWAPDTSIVQTWRESIRGANPVVITDQIDSGIGGDGCEFVQMPNGWAIPHLQRWVSTLTWLKGHEAQWVWLTDGSDVEMLNEPWDHMQRGVLYVGDEPATLSKPWMAQHHPFYGPWLHMNGTKQILNCGVVGGDRATVVEFLQDMVRELTRAYGHIDYEMGSFNYVLRQPHWLSRVEHGPHVTTTFKADERTEAWFKHK